MENDQDHAPDGQQRVSDSIGHGVAEAGIWLFGRMSLTMPSEAVVVRAPRRRRSRIASSNLKTYLPTYMPRTSGTVVATTPHRNRLKPSALQAGDEAGPGGDTYDRG